MELRAGTKKDFETNSRVSSLLQVCPSLIFNCGIRVYFRPGRISHRRAQGRPAGAREGLQKEDVTIAELLKAQGYMTGQFGTGCELNRRNFAQEAADVTEKDS
jgi:hypothetical protein